MVTCSYCSKQLSRLVFCSPSHKVMYHRKNPRIDDSDKLKERIKELEYDMSLLDMVVQKKLGATAESIVDQVKESLE